MAESMLFVERKIDLLLGGMCVEYKSRIFSLATLNFLHFSQTCFLHSSAPLSLLLLSAFALAAALEGSGTCLALSGVRGCGFEGEALFTHLAHHVQQAFIPSMSLCVFVTL